MLIITLSDIIGLFILAVILICFGTLHLKHWWKHRKCKHDGGVNETQACDAICRQCGKNLGFIGAWREKQK